MKKVFLTFGDGGANFTAARERIMREASRTGQFDEIVGCDWSNVSPEMQKSPLRSYVRGCGYWAWKSDKMEQERLSGNLRDGDCVMAAMFAIIRA